MEEPKDKKEQCIICTKKAESDDHLQTYKSWQTLHEAAKKRCYTPIMELDKQLGDKEERFGDRDEKVSKRKS